MTEANVVFDGDKILCNEKWIEISVHEDYELFYYIGDVWFSSLDSAIKYCLEN